MAMDFVVNLNALNPDAFIVRQNIARYLAGGDLDAAYLDSLSADAVLALAVAMTTSCPARSSGQQETYETEPAEKLQQGLQERLQAMEDDPRWRYWQSAQLSNWRAYQQLSKTFAALGQG